MQTHTIIEIEEGTLNVVVGARDGAQIRVQRSTRVPLNDLGREAIETALRGVGTDVLHASAGVHVIIGDRRNQHFSSVVPRMSARDVVGFVTREGMRLANLQDAGELLVETRLVRPLAQRRLQLTTSALSRGVWHPIRDALAQQNVTVLSLQTMESCLARCTSVRSDGPVAVVECNGGRARLVLCEDGAPTQVRRFMVSGGANNMAGVLTQLAMEVPRTLDWLRETNQSLPERLVLGPRTGIDSESMGMLENDDLGEVVAAETSVVCDDDLPDPGLAAATLLEDLCASRPIPSLLDAPRVRLPWGARQLMTLAASVTVMGLGCLSAVVDGRAWLDVRDQRIALQQQRSEVEQELSDPEIMGLGDVVELGDPDLDVALAMRRPASLLISEACNQCGEHVRLQEIVWKNRGSVVITGLVDGAGHQQALASLASFTKALRQLPYLVPAGQDEVSEVAGFGTRFQFKITMSWRHG